MPAAAYVETAALVNVARARIRAGHDPQRVKQAIGDAEDACRLHKFWQHLVVLRTAEVEQYRVGIGAESQADACYGALWAACHTHRRLLSSTVQRLSTSLAAHSDVNTAIAHVRSLLQRVMQEFDPKTWTPDPLLAMVAEDLCQRPQSKPLDSSAA
jgi:hypothetical protein